MREQRFVSYFRVSTDKQGRSGLGLEAQRAAVDQFIAARAATGCTGMIAEFVEIESGANHAEAVAYAATIEEHVQAARASGAKRLTRDSGLSEPAQRPVA
jgi:hypothetical protein